ncbi:hypothetical protein V2J09_015475 [Rumex salicifolius]
MTLRHCLYPSSADHQTPSPAIPLLPDSESSINSSLYTATSLQTLPSIPSLSHGLSPAATCNHHHSLSSPLQSPPLPPGGPFPSPSISALALSGVLLYAASGHRIDVYDSDSLSHLHSFNSDNHSSGSVKSIAFSSSPTRPRVFTAHQDGKIRVWKLTPADASSSSKTHRLITVLPTVGDRLRRLALPGNYVQVRRHKKKLWLHHNDAVSSLGTTTIINNNQSSSYNMNNGLVYSVSWDKSLKVWRPSDFRCLESVTAHDDAVNAVTVSPDGVVYTGSADKRIRVWARRVGEKKHCLIATLERHRSAVNALALSSDGKVLFSGACDRSILVWEREDSASYMVVSGALRGHAKAILCMVNVSDFLFSGSADRTVRIWRRAVNGQYCCLSVLEGHLKPVKSLVAKCESQRSHHDNTTITTLTVFSGSLDDQ